MPMAIGMLALGGAIPALGQAGDDSSLPSIPDYFQQKGLPRVQGFEAQSANEVINNFTGKLQYQFIDLRIPGNGGMDLVVQRSYSSIDDPGATPATWSQHEYSPVGLGWTMHMGRVIRGANKGICSSSWTSAASNPVLELPDGSRQVLYEQSSNALAWLTKDFWRATCQQGYLHVQSPDGTTYEMTAIGHLFGEPGSLQKTFYANRIVDRNGNWFNLNYQFLPNGTYALSQISTSDGRSVAFSYSGSTLSSITDVATGRVWQYTYAPGPGGRTYLSQVKRPDGQSWKYAYRASSPGTGSMSRVEYPTGGSIDYTYSHVDFRAGTPRSAPSTVIASKTAATNTTPAESGTWTWAYEVATQELPSSTSGNYVAYHYQIPPAVRDQLNVTTVTDPLGQATEHYHLGLHSVRQIPTDVGRYIGHVSAQQHLLLAYESVDISTQQDVVANLFWPGHYYPHATLTRRQSIIRAGESYDTVKSGFDQWGNPSSIVETGTNHNDRTYTRQTALTHQVNTSKWLLRQVSGETVTVDGQTHGTTRQFDANGNVLSQTVAGVTTVFSYHGTGDLHTQTNAKGQVTSYGSYHRGIARTESQPESVTITRSVDSAGNVTAQTNGRGKTTHYTYDGLGRLTSIVRPTGNPISITWGKNSRQVKRGGMTDLATFDGLGRQLRREVSAPGEAPIWVDTRHDILGRRLFQSYPNSTQGTGYQYDILDRVVATLHGSAAGSNSAELVEHVAYNGLRVVRQDTANRASIDFFRSFGDPQERHSVRTVAGELNNGQIYLDYDVHITRDLLGQPKTVTMGDKTRSYGYDSRYFLVSRTDPETGTTTFGRDAIGNMTSKRIGSQPATQYGYDGRDRLISINYPASEAAGVPGAPSVSRTYDGNDQLLSITSGNVVRSYSRDDGDKLVQESLTIDGASQTVGYAYDANEALSHITYPSGSQVSYQPDAFGRPRAVQPYVNQVSYHPNGMPSQVHYANGVVATMALNNRQWPGSLRVAHSGTPLVDNAYSYDPAGNLTQIGDTADPLYARLYQYDKLDRLIVEGSADGYREYYYDNTGNLTHLLTPAALNTYGYDAATGLLGSVTGGLHRLYQYDSAGNVSAVGSATLGHDRANNLRCIFCDDSAPITHTYDGDHMRVQSTASGVTTQYLHNHQGLLLQTLVPGAIRQEHIYLGRRQVARRDIPLN